MSEDTELLQIARDEAVKKMALAVSSFNYRLKALRKFTQHKGNCDLNPC
ncbi:unnamed protein product, partial [marine sediment metagenome]